MQTNRHIIEQKHIVGEFHGGRFIIIEPSGMKTPQLSDEFILNGITVYPKEIHFGNKGRIGIELRK